MTDADSDGSHIADLLLLMCLKMFPGLVESGKVFKAVPPLYGVPVGRNKMQYFAERVDFVKYMQKEFYKKNSVLNIDGKAIDPSAFSRILIENSDYIYDFATISERYKLNPVLLEIVLSSYIKGSSLETLRKRIVQEFRFMTKDSVVKMNSGTIKIKGLINGRIETLFYNERFIQECKLLLEPIKRAITNNNMEFIVPNPPSATIIMLVSSSFIKSFSRK